MLFPLRKDLLHTRHCIFPPSPYCGSVTAIYTIDIFITRDTVQYIARKWTLPIDFELLLPRPNPSHRSPWTMNITDSILSTLSLNQYDIKQCMSPWRKLCQSTTLHLLDNITHTELHDRGDRASNSRTTYLCYFGSLGERWPMVMDWSSS